MRLRPVELLVVGLILATVGCAGPPADGGKQRAVAEPARAADGSTSAVADASPTDSPAATPTATPTATATPTHTPATRTPTPEKRTPTRTTPASKCDPNYSGACVPIASDVDCAGGGGNGPAYVRGPVRVIGTDIYDLDRDNDGIGCE
jgi:hypothetical protein